MYSYVYFCWIASILCIFFCPICISFLPIIIYKLATRNISRPCLRPALSISTAVRIHQFERGFLPTIHFITCKGTDSGHRDPSNQPRCCCCTVKTPWRRVLPPDWGTHISLHACLLVNCIHLMSLGFLGPEAMCIQGLCSETTRRGPTMAVLCFPFISASAACRLLPKQMSVKETRKTISVLFRFLWSSERYCFSGGLPSVFTVVITLFFFPLLIVVDLI